ncbi:MAG: peptidylprolyl isomerase [Chloroflexota bacterium]|nr:peptidylprolyl isomerase [Chloroflexota bacterium]
MTLSGGVRFAVVLCVAVATAACGETGPSATPRPPCPTAPPTAATARDEVEGAERAVVATNKGSFTIELRGDAAPLATANFVALARCGFYDGIAFHRVLAGFIIQAGDPNTDRDRPGSDPTRIGSGGPGYRFTIEPPAEDLEYDRYSVSMANASAPDTNGSQFFIALADLTGRMSRDYTIFGQVVDGADVVDTIGAVPVNGPAGLPLDPVIIESITVSAASGATPSAD